MAEQHTWAFEVGMTCSGCSGAVERALSKLEHSPQYTVNLSDKSVRVVTQGAQPTFDETLERIRKTGKQIISASADGKTMPV